MRVAYTLEQCWHRVPGGTATAALEVARELMAWPQLTLVGVAARHRSDPPAAFRPPIPVRHLLLPRLLLYEAWHRRRWPPVERATGPVDLIHATGVAMPPRTAPIVLTVHDLAFLHDPDAFTEHGLRFFHAALDLALEQADRVLCSSEATATDCRAAGFDPAKLRVVPLGVRATPAGVAAVDEVRARYGLTRPFVLWVGTIEPRKNLPVVVEAFRRLARTDLDLVLVGPAGWNVDLDRIVRPVAPQVKVTGFLPRSVLEAVYAAAEVFCFPSLREGFGLPVAEAMAQGTPVVTSSGTSTAEVGGDAVVLVDPRDPAAVGEGLARVLDDRDLQAELRRAGRVRAGELSWGRCAQRTFKAYGELVP